MWAADRLARQLPRSRCNWARAHHGQVEIINLGFWPYAPLFEACRGNGGCAYPSRSTCANSAAFASKALFLFSRPRVDRWLRQLVHTTGVRGFHAQSIALNDTAGEEIDLDNPDFIARITAHRITMCSGWKIAGWRLFSEQQLDLRRLFAPERRFAISAEEFMAEIRSRYDLVVGVFVRQTDYRHWFDGRFFFSAREYAARLRQVLDLYSTKNVGFVIASDEKQDPRAFQGLSVHFSTGSINIGGHWFSSFVELSLCDVLLSPPSTFAATAAFVGGRPIWPLTRASQSLAENQLLHSPLLDAMKHPEFSACVQ